MSLFGDDAIRSASSFPRVSGDEPSSLDTSMRIDAFSPRERG